jgi:hypothetical protein
VTAPAPSGPADRFALVIAGLCRAIAARSAWHRLATPLLVLVWSRLGRTAARFAALAARVRAGTPSPSTAACRSGPSGPPPQRLPGNFAWLLRFVPEAAASASQLQHLLADPDMAALLAAAPQAGRLLRPLCRMLGVHPPPGIGKPRAPRPTPPPRPAAAEKPPPAASAPAPPRPPTRTWLRRTGLPGRLRPLPAPIRV